MNLEHQPNEFRTDVAKDDFRQEDAFQRAIIALHQAKLNDELINWIDIELPVRSASEEDQLYIDLIGENIAGDYVLCELKFGNTNDSPESAARQLIEYKNSLVKYAQELKVAGQNFNLHTNALNHRQLDLDKIISGQLKLIVAANKGYWEEQHQHWERNGEVKYFSVNVENNWFLSQSKTASGDRFIPFLPKFAAIWTQK